VTPGIRKLSLIGHVASSVGWMGAVAGFWALSIAGLMSTDAELVRSAYLAMNLVGLFVLVPLSLAAMGTGLVLAFGTPWGLFRYYWVMVKFLLTLVATTLLMLHQFTAVQAAAYQVANTAIGTVPVLGRIGVQLMGDAGFALLLLLGITALSEYKPWGKIGYSLRSRITPMLSPQTAYRMPGSANLSSARNRMPLRLKVLLAAAAAFLAGFIGMHLAGMGHGSHHH
jgi:hypothetical protein